MSKQVVVVLGKPEPKKHSVRFNAVDPDAALSTAYVTNAALKELGDPKEIRVTIEAASATPPPPDADLIVERKLP